MKRIFLLWSILFCFNSFAGDKETIKSTISDVTVYTNGAQIYRKANFTAKVGVTELILEGVSPNIDPRSLQVKAFGNVVIIDSKYDTYYPEPLKPKLEGLPLKIRNDIRLLQDSLDNMNYDLREIQDEIDVLNTSKNILSNNGAIKGQGKVNDSIQLLKQAMDYYQVKMNELNKKIQALQKRKTEKTTRYNAMNQRMQDLVNYQSSNEPEQPKGPIHRIIVTVQSKEVVTGKLNVSYLVSDASWVPSYDLRADINTGKVNLTYKALIRQNTQEKWDDVKITLSTIDPYQNKTKPELHPWYLDYYYQMQNQPSYGRTNNVGVYEKDALSKSLDDAKYEEQSVAGEAYNFTTMIDRVIAAEYKIDLPYTIESDGESHLILVQNNELTANYRYYCVPKIDPGVFLVAEILKLDELQLVPATANIFFDGTFMGETYLDPTTMSDTLLLSLGKDPNIIARRVLMKKDVKEKIIDKDIERTVSFEISIKNLKGTPVEIVVEDQLPITTNSEITIEKVDVNKANHDVSTGKLEWIVNLKAKESTKLTYSFKVKYPKDKSVGIQ